MQISVCIQIIFNSSLMYPVTLLNNSTCRINRQLKLDVYKMEILIPLHKKTHAKSHPTTPHPTTSHQTKSLLFQPQPFPFHIGAILFFHCTNPQLLRSSLSLLFLKNRIQSIRESSCSTFTLHLVAGHFSPLPLLPLWPKPAISLSLLSG